MDYPGQMECPSSARGTFRPAFTTVYDRRTEPQTAPGGQAPPPVTLPAAVYTADAPHADATAKDVCIKACNECLRCRAMRR